MNVVCRANTRHGFGNEWDPPTLNTIVYLPLDTKWYLGLINSFLNNSWMSWQIFSLIYFRNFFGFWMIDGISRLKKVLFLIPNSNNYHLTLNLLYMTHRLNNHDFINVAELLISVISIHFHQLILREMF